MCGQKTDRNGIKQNMKASAIIALLIVALTGICETNSPVSQTNGVSLGTEVVTTDGVVYKFVTIEKVEPDGLLISHRPMGGGIAMIKVRFETLSEALQSKYRYDPEKSAAYQAEMKMGQQRWMSEMMKLQTQQSVADRKREEDNWNGMLEREKLENQKRQAEAAQLSADAARKRSEAALAEARKPVQTPQINMQQNNFNDSSNPYDYYHYYRRY
jgi:hypothetical protein